MKKFLFSLLLVVVMAVTVNAQNQSQSQSQSQSSAQSSQDYITVFDDLSIPREYSKEDVQTIVLDNFDLAEDWSVSIPREQGIVMRKKVAAKSKLDDSSSQYCLGIKAISFIRGFNWVEIKPAQPVLINGRSKALSVLAVGRNFRHKLYAWVRDYRGVEYKIYMGSLNYQGWKRLATVIPDYVPQYSRYVPQYRPLFLTKFVIEFDPDEMPGNFYIYLDRLEAATDVYKAAYDGDDLLDDFGNEKFDTEQITAETNK